MKKSKKEIKCPQPGDGWVEITAAEDKELQEKFNRAPHDKESREAFVAYLKEKGWWSEDFKGFILPPECGRPSCNGCSMKEHKESK